MKLPLQMLSVRQPFASALVDGPKDVENRDWAPEIKPPFWFVLHAGKAWYQTADKRPLDVIFDEVRERWPDLPGPEALPRGFALGICRVSRILACEQDHALDDNPWAVGPFCWVIDQKIRFPTPIPCKGQQGLFEPPQNVLLAARTAYRANFDRKAA